MSQKWWLYLPLLFWTGLIVHLSTGPGIQVPFDWGDVFGTDKIGHLVFYGVHTGLLIWTFNNFQWTSAQSKWIISAFCISTLLGIAMEIIQYSFYPNRYFEILDIIANIIGSLIGAIIFKQLRR